VVAVGASGLRGATICGHAAFGLSRHQCVENPRSSSKSACPTPRRWPSPPARPQVELHTDMNQTLAKVRQGLASTEERPHRAAGIGAPWTFETTDRIVVLKPAGPAAAAVQIAPRGEPQPFRSVRPVAPRRSRRADPGRRTHCAERCVSRSVTGCFEGQRSRNFITRKIWTTGFSSPNTFSF